MSDQRNEQSNPLAPAARSVTTFGLAPAWDAGVVLVKSLRRLWELHKMEKQAAQEKKSNSGKK